MTSSEGSVGDEYSPVPDGDALMGKAPAFQFYAADFLMGTNDMTAEEVGAYIRMLASSWDKGPLPTDEARLARICGMEMKTFRTAWKTLSEKWVLTNEGYINERMEAQRAEREAYVKQQAEKGRRSGDARRTTVEPRLNHGSTTVEPEAQPNRSLQSSVFSLQEKNTHIDARAKHPAPLIDGRAMRLHGQHAWCSLPRDGLCVPGFLHDELIGKLGTADANTSLRAWYPTVVAKYEGRTVGDKALDFWRNEFAAWVGTVTTAPTQQRGDKTTRTLSALQVVLARQDKAVGDGL